MRCIRPFHHFLPCSEGSRNITYIYASTVACDDGGAICAHMKTLGPKRTYRMATKMRHLVLAQLNKCESDPEKKRMFRMHQKIHCLVRPAQVFYVKGSDRKTSLMSGSRTAGGSSDIKYSDGSRHNKPQLHYVWSCCTTVHLANEAPV